MIGLPDRALVAAAPVVGVVAGAVAVVGDPFWDFRELGPKELRFPAKTGIPDGLFDTVGETDMV